MIGKKQNLSWTEASILLVLLLGVFALYALALFRPLDHTAGTRLATLRAPTAVNGFAASLDYDVSEIRTGQIGVPRLVLSSMPEKYFEIETIPERKEEFLRILLPLVLLANEEIRIERQHLLEILALREEGSEIPAAAQGWLDALTEKYEVDPTDFATLLQRVDVVSPAVTLSQAIEETGWGRSRFLKQGNAFFGERTWTKGAGIVPTQRPNGGTYEVRRFDTLLDSVRAYALNLNTHAAYADYRALRADLQEFGRSDPAKLMDTLLAYSERGVDYIRAIQRVMQDNQLQHFETAKLADVAPVKLAQQAISPQTAGR